MNPEARSWRGPGTRAAGGIRSPGHQSGENVPSGWQAGIGESRSWKGNSRFCDVKFSLNRNKVIKFVSRRGEINFLVRIALQFCRMNVYWPEMLFGMEGFKNRQSFYDTAKF